MDNEATPGPLILVIEFGLDGVRAAVLASVPDAVRAALDDDTEPPHPAPPHPAPPHLEVSRPNWDGLTKRERIVARLVGQALTNQQIASRIRVSPHTVNYHLRQIYRKLGINSRVQLARLAAEVERLPR